MTDFKKGDRVLVSAGPVSDITPTSKFIPSTTGTVVGRADSYRQPWTTVKLDGGATWYYRPERLTRLDRPTLPDGWLRTDEPNGEASLAIGSGGTIYVEYEDGDEAWAIRLLEGVLADGPAVLRVLRGEA